MTDAVDVQEAMAEQQIMKQRRDELRLLLEQRMGPEDAAQFESHLESLVRAGLRTAESLERSNRQELESIGLPVGQILTLGEFFDIPGDPPAPSGQVLSLIGCCMDVFCHSFHLPRQALIP